MIAGAPVPLLRDARGAELHHSERHIRPHEHVPVPSGSYFRIDPFREVIVLCRGTGGGCEERRRKQEYVA